MEKTITVDGKTLTIKACAKNALIYRAQFCEDIFKAQGMLTHLIDASGNVKVENLDCLSVMKLVWTMNKTADNTVPDFEAWIDAFEEFPVMEILTEVQELLTVNMVSTTKIKNARAAASSQRRR